MKLVTSAVCLVLFGCARALAQGDAAPRFDDSAPPAVHPLEKVDAVIAKPHSGLIEHAKPRPLPSGSRQEDWPGFLGPRQDGHSRETGLVEGWAESGPTLLWEFERGQGYSSPIVVGGRVVYTHREENQSHVDCLDLETGRRYWRHSFPCSYSGQYIRDGGPRATPVADDRFVYVHGVEGRLMALELATGRVRWERHLAEEFDLVDSFFGVVASPLLDGDRLIVNLGAKGGPTVAAFDKNNGKLLWGAGNEWGASCASPVLAAVHGRSRLFVINGGKIRPPTGGLMVLDPEDGAVEFSFPFRSRTYESVNGASPLPIDDGVFLTASYGVGSVFLDLDPNGGFAERWRQKRFGIQFATPIRFEGAIWAVAGISHRTGEVVQLDPATGAVDWRTEVDVPAAFGEPGEERQVSMSLGEGSLLGIGDRVLCLGDTGLLLLVEPGEKGARIVSSAPLFYAIETWCPPVVSRGILLVCQNSPSRFGSEGRRLLAYDLRGE